MALAVLSALLLISAGCNGFGAGETDVDSNTELTERPVTATATPTTTSTPTPTLTLTPDPTARDLRQVELQVIGSDSYDSLVRGEIDRGDPRNANGFYEPIRFTAQANDTINISMRAQRGGDPRIELRAPNGSSLTVDDDGGIGSEARIENVTLPVTGEYTIIASSGRDSTSKTFKYRLTANRRAHAGELTVENKQKEQMQEPTGWFAGNASHWNKTERYSEWAYDFGEVANQTNNATDIERPVMVNTEQDYAVITLIGGSHLHPEQRQDIIASLSLSYINGYEIYKNESMTEDIPERMYFRFITPEERRLVRINALRLKSAKEGSKMDSIGVGPLIKDYFASIFYGPAHPMYREGGDDSGKSLSDFPGINRTGEVRPPLSGRVNNTTARINNSGS